MANYRLNKNGTISVDMAKLTKEEKEILKIYAAAGTKIIPAKKKTSIKKCDILNYINSNFNEEQAATLINKFCSFDNKNYTFMNGLKWFSESFPNYPEKIKQEDVEKKFKELVNEGSEEKELVNEGSEEVETIAELEEAAA